MSTRKGFVLPLWMTQHISDLVSFFYTASFVVFKGQALLQLNVGCQDPGLEESSISKTDWGTDATLGINSCTRAAWKQGCSAFTWAFWYCVAWAERLSGNTVCGQGLKIYLGRQRGGHSPVGDLIMQHTVGSEEQTDEKN